jgi:hypothetical protein
MFIGSGVVIGSKCIHNSFLFFFVIIFFKKYSLGNCNSSDHESSEEITETASKIGELAIQLKKKLLEA